MKKAVLVVSFGTSYKETREKAIEACEKKIKEGLEGYDFFRAFTSNMIIRKLKNRDGLHIENPIEALDRLYKEGYQEVIVQTLHIIWGEEFNKVKEQVESYKDKFEKIILGRPLLTYTEILSNVPEIEIGGIYDIKEEKRIEAKEKGFSVYGSEEEMLSVRRLLCFPAFYTSN